MDVCSGFCIFFDVKILMQIKVKDITTNVIIEINIDIKMKWIKFWVRSIFKEWDQVVEKKVIIKQ